MTIIISVINDFLKFDPINDFCGDGLRRRSFGFDLRAIDLSLIAKCMLLEKRMRIAIQVFGTHSFGVFFDSGDFVQSNVLINHKFSKQY